MYQPKTISNKVMVPNGKYPVFGANGVIGRYDDFNHEDPQLLITCRGATCGSVNVSEPYAWITGNAMVVRPKTDAISLRFLEYFFRGGLNLADAITGAAQPQITRANLTPLRIAYPPITEQHRIVCILDKAFENIAIGKANTKKNIANVRELFQSARQNILSPIVNGWIVKPLASLCDIKTGKKDVNQGNPLGQYPFFTCAKQHTYSDSYSFDTEAILVAGNGDVGSVSYYSGKFEAYQRTYVLKTFNQIPARLVFMQLEAFLKQTVTKQKLGNTMPYIKLGMLADFPIGLPPEEERDTIATLIESTYAKERDLVDLLDRRLLAITELEHSLFRAAFNGDL